MDKERCFLLSVEGIWVQLADFEKIEKTKATVGGVLDLTPTSSSLDNAINREEVQDENYGDEPTEFDCSNPKRGGLAFHGIPHRLGKHMEMCL